MFESSLAELRISKISVLTNELSDHGYTPRDTRDVLLYDVCQISVVDYIHRRAIIEGVVLQKEGRYSVVTPAHFVPSILLFCY